MLDVEAKRAQNVSTLVLQASGMQLFDGSRFC